MDNFDFTDRKVIVTGASSGVGRETAILLSRMGANVIILARREEELKKTIQMMSGMGHKYIAIDLSDFDGTVNAIKKIVADDGRKIDYIAHCAGVATPIPLRSISTKNIIPTFSTNFYSFAAILKCVASKKLFNDGGAVVGVSSCVAPYGQAANSVYGASKGAMDAMMKSAAKEFAPRRIRVNTVCPCGIDTDMLSKQVSAEINTSNVNNLAETLTVCDEIVSPDALLRVGNGIVPNAVVMQLRKYEFAHSLMKPESIASVIVSLLSDSMQCVSGVALDVDEAKSWED